MYHRTMTIEDLFRKLRPIFGKKIENLYLKYTMMDSREGKAEIEAALNALYQKHLTESLLNEEVLLEPPKQNVIKGDYPLGTVIYGKRQLYPFGLREKDWMRHCCVTGMSGSGKTTFAFQILGNFIMKKKPFLVFDWKKSFRPLMLLDEKLLIYTVGNEKVANFKLNITQPPKGVDPKEWINFLADLITESYSASFGVHKLIVDTLDRAYEEFGVYAGSGNYPTWYQIRDRMEERAANQTRKSRESEWLESALRISYSLTFGNFGASICYKGPDSSNIEEMFDKQVIMELASLANTEKKFFCQFILSYIYKYAKAGNVNVTEDFKYAIVVDEAHNIFLKDKPHFISESIPDVIFREIREYGVSLTTLDQHVSKLSDVVAGNSACNIAFQQMLPADIEVVSRLMQMQDNKNYFTKLPVGAAIVKLVERHYDPFIIQAPLMKLKGKTISDEDLSTRMKALTKNDKRKALFEARCKEEHLVAEVNKLNKVWIDSGVAPNDEVLREHIKAREATKAVQAAQERHQQETKDRAKPYGLTNHLQQKILDMTRKRLLNGEDVKNIKNWFLKQGWSRTDVMKTFNYIKRKGLVEKLSKKKPIQPDFTLTEEDKQFLITAVEHKDESVSGLYALAGFNPRKGNDIKKRLEDLGVIEITEVKTAKGWKKYVKILYTDIINKQLT